LSRVGRAGVDPDVAADDRVARLKRGEARAFDEVYDELRPRIYRFLLRLTHRRELAEDLLQETFIRLATRATELSDDTDLAAWLFTVARNLFVSHRRWVLVDADRLRAMKLWPGASARDDSSPFEQLAASETERRVEAALASMPVAYREVVLLVAVERLEPASAALVLGLRPDAFRQRLARARSMLAGRLRQSTEVE